MTEHLSGTSINTSQKWDSSEHRLRKNKSLLELTFCIRKTRTNEITTAEHIWGTWWPSYLPSNRTMSLLETFQSNSRKNTGLLSWQSLAGRQVPKLPSCMTLSTLLNFSEFQILWVCCGDRIHPAEFKEVEMRSQSQIVKAWSLTRGRNSAKLSSPSHCTICNSLQKNVLILSKLTH